MGFLSRFIDNAKRAANPVNQVNPLKAAKDPANNDPLGLFTPKPPADPAAAPPAPTNADLSGAEEAERQRQLRARGFYSTISTSGQGDTSIPSLARRFLLGS